MGVGDGGHLRMLMVGCSLGVVDAILGFASRDATNGGLKGVELFVNPKSSGKDRLFFLKEVRTNKV